MNIKILSTYKNSFIPAIPDPPVAKEGRQEGANVFIAVWNMPEGSSEPDGFLLSVWYFPSGKKTFVNPYNEFDVGDVNENNVNVPESETYYYSLKAYNEAGTSGESNTMSVLVFH